MFELEFLGYGSAFNHELGPSNALIHHNSKKLLIDCGDSLWAHEHRMHDLEFESYSPADVDAIVITHLHADHVGGLPELAHRRFFGGLPRAKLILPTSLMAYDIWHKVLSGGLECLIDREAELQTFFDIITPRMTSTVGWEGLEIDFQRTTHVGSMPAYSLEIFEPGSGRIFYSGDRNRALSPDMFDRFDRVFHECESGTPSGVHTPIEAFAGLSEGQRQKLVLYHLNGQLEGPQVIPYRGRRWKFGK